MLDKGEKKEIVGELFERFTQLHEEYVQLWVEHTFLHWDWWIALGLSLSSWTFWIFYHNKRSTQRLLYAGMHDACHDHVRNSDQASYRILEERALFRLVNGICR